MQKWNTEMTSNLITFSNYIIQHEPVPKQQSISLENNNIRGSRWRFIPRLRISTGALRTNLTASFLCNTIESPHESNNILCSIILNYIPTYANLNLRWLTFKPTLELSLTKLTKTSTNSSTYLQNLNFILSKYPDFDHIYIDESKSWVNDLNQL